MSYAEGQFAQILILRTRGESIEHPVDDQFVFVSGVFKWHSVVVVRNADGTLAGFLDEDSKLHKPFPPSRFSTMHFYLAMNGTYVMTYGWRRSCLRQARDVWSAYKNPPLCPPFTPTYGVETIVAT